MTFQPLTRTIHADTALALAVSADRSVRQAELDRLNAVKYRGRYITDARAEGCSLKELAQAFGKSIEWVRQAEKKGQAK